MGTAPESAVTLNPGPDPTSTDIDWRAAMQSTEVELVSRMRKASRAVYLATDAAVADDISDMLRRAADIIEGAGDGR